MDVYVGLISVWSCFGRLLAGYILPPFFNAHSI